MNLRHKSIRISDVDGDARPANNTHLAERNVTGSGPSVGRGIEAVFSIPSFDPLEAEPRSNTLIVVVVTIASFTARPSMTNQPIAPSLHVRQGRALTYRRAIRSEIDIHQFPIRLTVNRLPLPDNRHVGVGQEGDGG